MYARRSETPCCFFVGVPTKERSSSTFLRAQRNSHIHRWSAHKCGRFSSFFLFFFFRLRSLLFSLFLVPRRRVKCSTHCFHVVFWIKALLLKKSHFFPVLVVQKKSPNSQKSFLPTKTKKIWQKYLSDPHAFLSFFFTLIIQSSQNFLGF